MDVDDNQICEVDGLMRCNLKSVKSLRLRGNRVAGRGVERVRRMVEREAGGEAVVTG